MSAYPVTDSLGMDLTNNALDPLRMLEPYRGNTYEIQCEEIIRLVNHPLSCYVIDEACKWADHNGIPSIKGKMYAVMLGFSKEETISLMGVTFIIRN